MCGRSMYSEVQKIVLQFITGYSTYIPLGPQAVKSFEVFSF
jgi:hypothetical protein